MEYIKPLNHFAVHLKLTKYCKSTILQLKSPPLVITNIQFPNNPACPFTQSGGQCCFLLENTVFIFPQLDMQDFGHLDIYLVYLCCTWLGRRLLPLLSVCDYTSVEKGLHWWVDWCIHSFIHPSFIHSNARWAPAVHKVLLGTEGRRAPALLELIIKLQLLSLYPSFQSISFPFSPSLGRSENSE